MKGELYDWLVTTTRPVSNLGVQTPDAVQRQCKRRFQRDIWPMAKWTLAG